MDYTIGSLADLISGKNTPNKPRILKVPINKKTKKEKSKVKGAIKEYSEGIKKSKKNKQNGIDNGQTERTKQIKTNKNNLQIQPSKKLTGENNFGTKIGKKVKHKVEDTLQTEKKKSKVQNITNIIVDQNGDNIRKKKKRKSAEILNDKGTKRIKIASNFADSDEEPSVTEDNPDEANSTQKNGDNIRKKKKRKSTDIINDKGTKRIKIASNFADSDEEPSVTEDNPDEANSTQKKVKIKPDPEEVARTIFVGNVPIKIKKKKLKAYFKKYGPIESLRFRGIPVADPKITKKVAAIKNEFHPDRTSLYCYIRFLNKDDAQKALVENGVVFEDHHLRVHVCDTQEKPDESKAIFIGNLSFAAEEEELWKLFSPCGPISHIRIIRDPQTGMGKGFAYINFKDSDAVQLALEMENVTLGNRELRIKLSNIPTDKKNKKKTKNSNVQNAKNAQRRKEYKKGANATDADPNSTHKWNKSTKAQGFQGSKFNPNKKRKLNKGLMNQKRNIKKIAPFSK